MFCEFDDGKLAYSGSRVSPFGGFALDERVAVFSGLGMLGLKSCRSALLEERSSVSESFAAGLLASVFFESAYFGSELGGYETPEPLSRTLGSDAIGIWLSPALEGFGVLLGSFARIPDAGAGTIAIVATEPLGST